MTRDRTSSRGRSSQAARAAFSLALYRSEIHPARAVPRHEEGISDRGEQDHEDQQRPERVCLEESDHAPNPLDVGPEERVRQDGQHGRRAVPSVRTRDIS